MVRRPYLEALNLSGSRTKIKDLAPYDRPKEKALRYGVNSLTNIELLAILINTGTRDESAITIAEKLLNKHHTLTNLAKITEISDFSLPGIKTSKALTLLAAFTLSSRVQKDNFKGLEYLKSSGEIANKYIYDFSSAKAEMMLLVVLDKTMKIIKEQILYLGTRRGFDIDAKAIKEQLIKLDATYYVLVHNHPSGNVFPSEEDIETTIAINKITSKAGIAIYDHLIIADYTYFSFKDYGLIV